MREEMSRVSRVGRAAMAALLLLGGGALGVGCLDRPVVPQEPNTSNVFVATVPTKRIDKIDLVFMIDNSASMGDKQEILKQAVPNLLRRLIQPDCLDSNGQPKTPLEDGKCPEGSEAAFLPIKDIHIATITSALGGHGGHTCGDDDTRTPVPNDFARLLPTVRDKGTVPDPDGTGFLAWHGGTNTERDKLLDAFGNQVIAAGQNGCGFEASLESWYRFLVDPNPPPNSAFTRDADNRTVRLPEPDNTLLEQRRAFLRSDSLLAIIMLSDENDCSIADEGYGWMVTSPDPSDGAPTIRMKSASEACDTNPNDACCYSCFFPPPSGCAASPRCQVNEGKLATELDRGEVRCADQKRRFGIDFLYPVQRYIDALTKTEIVDTWDPARPLVPNELFIARNGAPKRDLKNVVLAGIVGVPWQDIATPESLTGTGLTYLQAEGIPWDKVLGDPKKNVPPSDPLMIESIAPRSGPGIAAPGTWDNPINGNEVNTAILSADHHDQSPANDDLQYACVFKLDTKLDCTGIQTCDCNSDDDLSKGKPLCQDGKGGTQGHLQYYAKAYPGTRFLEVLKGIGDKAIVASICPKNSVKEEDDPADPNIGYNPAVEAIIGRLGKLLGGQCLPSELDIDPATNGVSCVVIEAAPQLGDPSCVRAGREPVKPEVARAVRNALRDKDECDGETDVACEQIEMCGIRQLTEQADKQSCFYEKASNVPGFCYIDPAKGEEAGGQCENGICTNEFVDKCPPEQRRILRFVGTQQEPIPFGNATMLTACIDG